MTNLRVTCGRRRAKNSTAEDKVRYLRGCENEAFNYIRGPRNTSDPLSLVRNTYSFIGLAERYDESMVLLASILRVPLSQAWRPCTCTCTTHMHMHTRVQTHTHTCTRTHTHTHVHMLIPRARVCVQSMRVSGAF